MDHFQRKQEYQPYSDEFLFTPRNSQFLEKSQKSDDDEGIFTEKVKRINQNKYSMLTPNQETIKRIERTKGTNFMKNIKNDLVSLKTQVNKMINENNEQKLYEDSLHLKNMKRANSQSCSQISLDSYQSQFLLKRMMKNQAEQIDLNNTVNITERRLKFVEQENEMLKIKIKKMKNQYKQYKQQAEIGIRMLNDKLQEAQEVIASHEQQMGMYKRQVQQQMINIKKMLVASKDVLKKKASQVSIQQNIQYKKLLEKTMLLKQNLQFVSINLNQEKIKSSELSVQNQRLKQQIQYLTNSIEGMINKDNHNNSLFKCGQSKINLDYSQSGTQKQKGDKQETVMFNLQDCLEKKESFDFKSALSYSDNIKKQDIKKQYQVILVQNQDLYKQIRSTMKQLQDKNSIICELNKQNQLLSNKITLLQNQVQQLNNKCSESKLNSVNYEKDQYIRQLQDKIDKLEYEIQSTKSQMTKSSNIQTANSSQINSSDSLRQKDMQITYLKSQLQQKNEQVDNLRDSLGNLHKQFRDSRGQVDLITSKFTRQIKHLRQQLETTRLTLKSQISLLQQINEELNIKNKGNDKGKQISYNQYQFEFQNNKRYLKR